MNQDEIKTLAKQAGGTPYINRHFPGETAAAFGPIALVEFVRLVQAAEKPTCFCHGCGKPVEVVE